MSTVESVSAAPLVKRKKTYLFSLAGVGLLHGALYSYGLSHPPSQMGIQLFMTFTLNLCLLGWCYVDAQEKKIPITRFLGLALLCVWIVGLPWYFLRSRGFFGAIKAAFGLGLILLWFVAMLLTFVPCEIASGHVAR